MSSKKAKTTAIKNNKSFVEFFIYIHINMVYVENVGKIVKHHTDFWKHTIDVRREHKKLHIYERSIPRLIIVLLHLKLLSIFVSAMILQGGKNNHSKHVWI